jgi:hypothetical protein
MPKAYLEIQSSGIKTTGIRKYKTTGRYECKDPSRPLMNCLILNKI